MLDLGAGLEIWRVHVDELREQDENAQAMSKAMFERLSTTIGADRRLESLPLCALVGDKLEIISGHHRVRAARASGLTEIFVIVDVTGLSRSRIRAKQLAHNAIAGQSNPEIIARIYAKIEEANARLESFIDPVAIGAQVKAKIRISPVEFQLEHRMILVAFMPTELEAFDRALKALEKYAALAEEVWIADVKGFDKFKLAMQATEQAANVRAVGTILDKMADMVMEAIANAARDATA
jgi:hypothetical protein